MKKQELGLRYIREAAGAYARSEAPSGPGLVAALSDESADWAFAHFLDSYGGGVNIGISKAPTGYRRWSTSSC